MRIFIASDHAGFDLKRILVDHLHSLGHEVIDKGPKKYDPEDDYPDYISLVGKALEEKPSAAKGIVIGGSGQGEAICANKFYGVRAVVYYGGNMDIVKLSREHNDANVLSIGARFVSPIEAKRAAALWLATPFSGDVRHVRRIQKLYTIAHSHTHHNG